MPTATTLSAAGGPLFAAACAACGEAYPAAGLPAVCPVCGGFWRYGDGFGWHPPGPAAGLRRWAPALGLAAAELPPRLVAAPPGLYAVAAA